VADQDYRIVSMKMEISSLEKELRQKIDHLEHLTSRNRNIENISRLLSSDIIMKRVDIYESIESQTAKGDFERSRSDQLSRDMV